MAESVVDVIARARRAQQSRAQRHDVQLEVPGWDVDGAGARRITRTQITPGHGLAASAGSSSRSVSVNP